MSPVAGVITPFLARKGAVRRVVDDRRRNLAMTAICRRNATVNARAPRIVVEQDEVRRPLGDVELNETPLLGQRLR